MHIEILATESLGVRGLSCSVTTAGRRVVIDPGAALGYQRFPVPPGWHDDYSTGKADTSEYRDERL